MEGFQIVTIKSVVGEIDTLTSVTSNYDTITIEHLKKGQNVSPQEIAH